MKTNVTNKTAIDFKSMLKQTGLGAAFCGSKLMEFAVFAVFASATLNVVYRAAENPVIAATASAGGIV